MIHQTLVQGLLVTSLYDHPEELRQSPKNHKNINFQRKQIVHNQFIYVLNEANCSANTVSNLTFIFCSITNHLETLTPMNLMLTSTHNSRGNILWYDEHVLYKCPANKLHHRIGCTVMSICSPLSLMILQQHNWLDFSNVGLQPQQKMEIQDWEITVSPTLHWSKIRYKSLPLETFLPFTDVMMSPKISRPQESLLVGSKPCITLSRCL